MASLLFVGAIGALIARQVANFIDDLPSRITEVQDFINRNFSTSLDFGDLINRIDKGKLAGSLANNTISFTTHLLGGLLQVLTILLLTFYMVADGPRLRRVICRRLRPDRQQRVLHAWELAIDKTGGYLYSRALLALLSAVFHTAAFSVIGLRYPVALGIWVGLVSQFLPVIGTYLAGVLPVLVALLDDPDPRPVGADRDRHLPADRELPVRAPHHGADAGAPPGGGLLRGDRRRGHARPGRRGAGPAGVRDGPGLPQRVGSVARRGESHLTTAKPPPGRRRIRAARAQAQAEAAAAGSDAAGGDAAGDAAAGAEPLAPVEPPNPD